MANGINPLNGEMVPDSDLINNIKISRYLFYVNNILNDVLLNGGAGKNKSKVEKVDGYYIMNDNYFDEFILQAIINKKYLSEEQIELLKQDVIEFEIKDPF